VRASRIAAGYGARVAVAEEYRVGGTCVIRGCVPKKLLVYGSHFAEELQDAANYGWTVEKMTFDWPTLRDAVPGMSTASTPPIRTRSNSNKVEHFLERATITGPNTVRSPAGARSRRRSSSWRRAAGR
jgi:glutathione reductase (NADPH)